MPKAVHPRRSRSTCTCTTSPRTTRAQVYFSSCPHSVLLRGFPLFLPQEKAPRFGANRWAVLLNQTAVMANPEHLARALAAIPRRKVEAMRRCLAGLRERFSFSRAPSERDAVATLVQRMLRPSAAHTLEAQCEEGVE